MEATTYNPNRETSRERLARLASQRVGSTAGTSDKVLRAQREFADKVHAENNE